MLRALRLRRGLRQVDIARGAGCAHATVSRIERGHLEELTVARLRHVAGALNARVVIDVRWRGAEAARLLDERHAALQQELALRFARLPGWEFAPEVSFSIYGERGSIDVLARHRASGAVLVVELKSELVNLQDLLATVDRKRRLAPAIARERGWACNVVGTWVLLEEGRENRRRVAAHRHVLIGAFPSRGREIRAWLAGPGGTIAALSILTIARAGNGRRSIGPRSRVSRRPTLPNERARCVPVRPLLRLRDESAPSRLIGPASALGASNEQGAHRRKEPAILGHR